MLLALYPGMFDHGSRIRLQTRHGATNVFVNFDNLLNRGGFEERRGDTFLHTENNTFRCRNLSCISGTKRGRQVLLEDRVRRWLWIQA